VNCCPEYFKFDVIHQSFKIQMLDDRQPILVNFLVVYKTLISLHTIPCGRAQSFRSFTVDAHTVALKPVNGKITRHYLRYYTVAFCYVHECGLSFIHPGHDV